MSRSDRTSRSSSVPKLAVKAGLIAMSDATMPVGDAHAAIADDGPAVSISNRAIETSTQGDTETTARMTFQVNENWDAGRHGPVLKKLIAKKARQMGRLSQDEAELLSTLQSMRRASLPPSMSYEEFIRERKRVEDLEKVMDAMAEYKRKYCAASHGAEERS